MTLADRVAAAYTEVMWRQAAGVAGGFAENVAGVTVVSLGLPERWATMALALTAPADPASVEGAMRRIADRGLVGQLLVRDHDRPSFADRDRVDVMPVFAAPAAGEQDRLDVGPAADAEEFRAVYRAAFSMRPGLAEALVGDRDLLAERSAYLVGRADGVVVSCALVRPAGGLGYVSAVGVLSAYQGRGFGTAMLTACATEAGSRDCRQVFLHASANSRGFYEGIGFELVDTHVALA